MNVLTMDAVAEIKASEGIYRASDVARNYNVHRSTVKRIWDGSIHAGVSPAGDFPDISVRPAPRDMYEDVMTLMKRGLNPAEVAMTLGISESAVWQMRRIFL